MLGASLHYQHQKPDKYTLTYSLGYSHHNIFSTQENNKDKNY